MYKSKLIYLYIEKIRKIIVIINSIINNIISNIIIMLFSAFEIKKINKKDKKKRKLL